jgi:hypothetical protein
MSGFTAFPSSSLPPCPTHASQAWRLWALVFLSPARQFFSFPSSHHHQNRLLRSQSAVLYHLFHLSSTSICHTSQPLGFLTVPHWLAQAFCLHFGWHVTAARLARNSPWLKLPPVSTPPTTNGASSRPRPHVLLNIHPIHHHQSIHLRLIHDKMTEVSSTRLYLGNLPRNGTLRHSRASGKAAMPIDDAPC